MNTIRRGDIYWADLQYGYGSEQGGVRPVLIVQNDVGNRYSPTTIVVTITTKSKGNMPTHVDIHKDRFNGLKTDSVIVCEQIRTIDKDRLSDKIGHIDNETLFNVLGALKISLMMQ